MGKETNQSQYDQMAIEWATKFIKDNEPMLNFKACDGWLIENSHYTLTTWVDILIYGVNREKYASFYRIKKFKDWYETNR